MTTTRPDRAALVRRALVELVADHGIHGTSMSHVARHAGVATGTAYVHYESKQDVLIAAFVETKKAIAEAALAGATDTENPRQLFERVWRNIYRYVEEDPAVGRFLVQVEVSPLREQAHAVLGVNALTDTADLMRDHLVDLPDDLLYDLGLAPAVTLAATGLPLSQTQLSTVINSCWAAISR